MRDKMPRKGGRWWFSWRGRNKQQIKYNTTTTEKESIENH